MALNTLRMKIVCRTLFDCSLTGVTGHFRPSEIPFVDRAGQQVRDQPDWNHSRNQQRNWETLLQIISLRTQPADLSVPTQKDGVWEFEFRSESQGVFEVYGDPDHLAGLRIDCEGVPMVTGLNEQEAVVATLRQGKNLAVLGNAGVQTNATIPDQATPPVPLANLIPATYSASAAANLVIS